MKAAKALCALKATLLPAMLLACLSCTNSRQHSDGSAEKVYIAAINAYGSEDYPKALELAQRALKIDKKFYQALFLKAKILFFDNKIEEALRVFSRLAASMPAFTEARLWQIHCQILCQKYDLAEKALEKELSVNHSDWRVYSLYALLGEKTGNYEQRLVMNRRAETILADSAKLYLDLALSWELMGLSARSEEYMKKASCIGELSATMAELEKSLKQTVAEMRKAAAP